MKKFLASFLILAALSAHAIDPKVDDKVVRAFEKSFPQAEKVSWYTEQGHYEVVFLNGTVNCRICYDRSGRILKTVRYYKADGLSPFILAKVQQRFPGKNVFGVTEISTDEGVQYHLVLEDSKMWYDVTADASGSLIQNKKFRKA